jgi:hypothetical protein
LAVSRSYHAASAGNAARYCGIMGRSTYGDKPMRTSATLIAIAMSALASQAVLAQPAPPASPVHATCESKRAEIARDIEHAKAKGQSSRVRGLEKALRETRSIAATPNLRRNMPPRLLHRSARCKSASASWTRRGKRQTSKIADREAKLAKERAELEKLR